MNGRAVVVATLLVGWLLAGSAVLAAPAAANSIDIDSTLSESPASGEVDVRTTVTIPDGITSLRITLPEETDVYETDGFQQSADDPNAYEWTRETDQPSLRYSYEGNITVDRGDGQEYIYAVTDEWAVVRSPSIGVKWSPVDADVNRNYSVAGEGVAGRHISYLGPYTEHDREASGQRFRLVVSDRSDMAESPEDVLDSLAAAARRIEGGERDAEVLVFAVPSTVEWAATGLQRGDSDMWVRDVERLDTPANTWVHEYVHTRQDYDRTEKTRWTVEGMADYYAALIAYEQGHIDYEAFRRRMERGTADRHDDVRLTDPATWEGTRGNYEKGALVFGHLDRRLRADADSSLDAAIQRFNQPNEELTHEAFLDAIEDAGNADIREDAARYTETTDTPEVWSREEHVAAFGGPEMRYEFVGFAVDGPYRTTGLDEPRLVTGETLRPTVRVRNVGTQEGDFSAGFTVDGEAVATETGTLAPDEETTVEFAHAFESTGEYGIGVGAATDTVTVEAPAAPEVTGVSVEPTDPALGETVAITATVESSAERPAAGDVTIAVDGGAIGSEDVAIGSGTTTVSAETSFDAPGEYTVSAGARSTTVTVRDETANVVTPTAGSDGTPPADGRVTPTADDGAGLGAGVAILGLLGSLLFARRR
ncbi:CARDB domain-containing protein [Natronomonas amylolytica]|uniref:CARDB domain-containing protein n=1 Tax=Natronomonas amylolytica TaxID=3108498 RepID=UPI0030090675